MAVIAVGGAYGTLSEIGHALAEDIPVIGLQTWNLTRSGEPPDTAITTATNPTDAVEKAIRAAQARLQAFQRHRPNPDKAPSDGFS